MSVTVRELLERFGCMREDSIYAGSTPEMLDFKLFSKDFYELDTSGRKAVLRFKNSVDILDFDQLKNCLPELRGIRHEGRDKFPYFVENLGMIAAALDQDRKQVAVEGGPCLFSMNEVVAEVTDRNGRTAYFDYSEGEPCGNTVQEIKDENFAVYVRKNIADIRSIHFQCYKTDLSPQEYLHLHMPFEVASALGTGLVITLPDMSYLKYLESALEGADSGFRTDVLREFNEILCRTTEMYLQVIRDLQDQFRVGDFTILYSRNQEMLDRFYKEREPFIERNKVLKNLTGKPEKLEPLKDYISMPALPYYLHGATRILEVNSVVEADSFRKCMRAHKGVAEFACILFPELLSGDGVNTMYFAMPEYKQYGSYK
ncbi:MAG: hypothetical protein IJ061_09935 [Lachnospiraceae bacterium]|nr:hypothetical protein [Lachnospiraceae bacterium]